MEPSPVISLRKACIMQGDHRVLSDVDLEVGTGEFVYVIGATGSGKSSLLKTLYADLPLESGTGQVVGTTWSTSQNEKFPTCAASSA